MSATRVAIARVRALFRRNAIADEIREELEFHVAMRADEYARDGLDAHDARYAALRRFGNPAVIQDRGYDERGGGVLETIVQDVKYGVRQLRRQPSFSIVAILTLALGIGVSTALFSVIDAALLRPLPYAHPEELVTLSVEESAPGGDASQFAPSIADIRAWRTLPAIIAHAGTGRVNDDFVRLIVDAGTPQRLVVAAVSEDFIETYGVSPVLGRGIEVADTRDGAPKVAVLGHAFWRREFGGDGNVIGRALRIDNEPATIVGVLPAGFYDDTSVWRAKQFTVAAEQRRGSGESVIGRLRPGVSIAQAAAAMDSVIPASPSGRPAVRTRVILDSMYSEETHGFTPTIRTLAMAVGLILLIACVNVAGLTLARGATRDVELAIRASIGAGRGRLIRQLLTESVLLAVAAAILGVLIAHASLDSLVALIPLSLPANAPVTIDATVLAFAVTLTVLTALFFGLVPAIKLSRARRRISTTLTVTGRGSAPLSKRAGQWLMAIEVMLALVLTAGSGLLLRSFARLISVDLGFDGDHVITLEVEPVDRSAVVRSEYYASLVKTLQHVPEIASVGAIDQLGLTGGGAWRFPHADTGSNIPGFNRVVVPGYFETLRVRPIAGRLFEDADLAGGEAVLVNATASRQFFGGTAVGHTLEYRGEHPRQCRIVGVVPDLRHGGPQARPGPEIYVLPEVVAAGTPSPALAVIMRLREGQSLSADRLKQLAESVGPRVVVGRVRPVAALVSEQVATPRHRMLLLTLLGAFGLALTLVGIFSMTAYAVARRTREIGVRMALGARPAQVVGAIVRDALWPVAFGLAAGLAGTYYATRLITSFLFQTPAHDPATLIAVVGLLGVAAVLAAWLPARRAAAVDPLFALRAD